MSCLLNPCKAYLRSSKAFPAPLKPFIGLLGQTGAFIELLEIGSLKVPQAPSGRQGKQGWTYMHRRTGDLGILEFWDFPFEFQVRQQFKSDGKIINQRASEGFREPQIASKGLRGLQRASWGLREPIFFLFFSFHHFFFTFLPLVLSPTPF